MNTVYVGGLQIPADTGCEVSPSCLRCPLPVCKYDLIDDALTLRNQEMRELAEQGEHPIAIAARYHVHRRTVYRVLAGGRS